MVIAPGSKRAVRMAADSSGLQRNDRGEWMTKKRKLERGFAGARVPADADARRVLALKVTDEKAGDAPVFEALVTGAVAAPDGAAARGEARGKEAEEESAGAAAAKAEEKEEAAAAIAAGAVRSAPGEAAAARAVAADDGGTAREREPEASVSAAAAAAAAEGAGAEKAIRADGAYASRKNVAPCRELGIVPFIMMGKNATTAGKGEGDGRGGAVRE